ncbi:MULTISPECIES: hypothetical protein [Pseudomonas]|nr:MULTISPECIES: hypothetical protein [Pseudomonas]
MLAYAAGRSDKDIAQRLGANKDVVLR